MFCFQCLEPFHFPITAFFGLQDKRCTEMKVYQWRFFTKSKFELIEVGGNHLFPLDKDCKKVWQMWIVDRLVDFYGIKDTFPLSQLFSSSETTSNKIYFVAIDLLASTAELLKFAR